MKKVELIKTEKNNFDSASLTLKIEGMRKPQEFTVYPINKDSKYIVIQSSTRIAQIDPSLGIGVCTKSYPNGAYFHHLAIGDKYPIKFNDEDWILIKQAIIQTNGIIGSDKAEIYSDNTNAKNIFDL